MAGDGRFAKWLSCDPRAAEIQGQRTRYGSASQAVAAAISAIDGRAGHGFGLAILAFNT
jgi:hypothetical protein